MKNINPHKFTYIIGYRHRLDRIINLRRVIDWVSGFDGVEIILVEQDKKSQIEDMVFTRPVKYHFIETELPFNKSHAFNVGLKYATTDILVFGDSDIIMMPDDLIGGLVALSEYECVSPYNRVIDLMPDEVGYDLDVLSKIDRPGRGETNIQKICLCGGIMMYRRESIEKVGGWPEDFIGWGGEDDAQTIKTKRLLKWEERSSKCYHLYHPSEVPISQLYQRNIQLLNQINQMDDASMSRYIQSSRGKIGLKNKLY